MRTEFSPSLLKVAIVHDFAFYMGGAERCVEAFCEIFPQADLFMLFGDKSNLSEKIQKHKINYSFLNKLPGINKFYRNTYPLWPLAIESFEFSDYDLVISQSTVAAKGIVTGFDTPHICFMNASMRYAWDLKYLYFGKDRVGLKKFLINPFLSYLRIWDSVANMRPDYLVTGSDFQRRRVYKYFKRRADAVLNPPVYFPNLSDLNISDDILELSKEEHYIGVAPFKPNKGGELMIETAKKMGFNLYLIGGGSRKDTKRYRRLSHNYKNIKFLGWVTEDDKWHLLKNAKAMLFCGIEDFGISAVEAIYAGTPVVAYKAGGALETVKPDKTGVFFSEHEVDSVIQAIKKVEEINWDRSVMKDWAKRFGHKNFKKEFADFVENAYNTFVKNF